MNLLEATIKALQGKLEEKPNNDNAEINAKILDPISNRQDLEDVGYSVERNDGFTTIKKADRKDDFREIDVFDDGEVLTANDNNINDKSIKNKKAFDAKSFLDTNRKKSYAEPNKVSKFKMNKDTIAQADEEIANAEELKANNPEDASILDNNVIKPWQKLKDKANAENRVLLKKTEDVNSSEFNLYIKPEELADVNISSLLFDSDTTIANYREGKHLLSLMVRGSVKIENTENGDVYKNYQSFPDELVEQIKAGKIDENKYYIDMNNWFEWFLDEVEGNASDTIWYDVADIEGMLNKATPEENETELEVIMKDLFDDVVSDFKEDLDESKKIEDRKVLGEYVKATEDKELLAEIDDPENLGEDFYEKICRAYVDTMNLEWVTTNPENNDSVVHGYFADDDTAEKWNYGAKVTPENFKDAAYDGYTQDELDNQVSKLVDDVDWYEYDTWLDFYDEYVKDEIAYDINDIGVYSLANYWDFYISEEDLTKLGLWNEDMKAEFLDESKKEESVVSDYTLSEIKKVLDSKETEYGYSLKITNSGADEETRTLDLDKSDLQAIYDALSKNKITKVNGNKELTEGINVGDKIKIVNYNNHPDEDLLDWADRQSTDIFEITEVDNDSKIFYIKDCEYGIPFDSDDYITVKEENKKVTTECDMITENLQEAYSKDTILLDVEKFIDANFPNMELIDDGKTSDGELFIAYNDTSNIYSPVIPFEVEGALNEEFGKIFDFTRILKNHKWLPAIILNPHKSRNYKNKVTEAIDFDKLNKYLDVKISVKALFDKYGANVDKTMYIDEEDMELISYKTGYILCTDNEKCYVFGVKDDKVALVNSINIGFVLTKEQFEISATVIDD